MTGRSSSTSSLPFFVAAVVGSAALSPALTAGALDDSCLAAELPAATLLFPYFAIDLDDFGGETTLLSVVNARTDEPTLAHVVLWTDWGIPSSAFDLYLAAGDVETMNLRDLFLTGSSPITGPGADVFPDCVPLVGGFLLSPPVLQALHTGREVQGGCLSAPRSVNVATGYVTVDVIRRCSAGIRLPSDPGYFDQATGVASTDNRLWGDFFFVDTGESFSQGETAVHLVADPDRFRSGGPTFYGKFVGTSAADARVPLSSEWRSRYLLTAPFDATTLLVWRDVPTVSTVPLPCGTAPPWFPLGTQSIVAWNESGLRVPLGAEPFPIATQAVDSATGLAPPFPFGWIDLDLDLDDGFPSQAWVMATFRAAGRFSVGQSGVRMNDLCRQRP